MVCSKLLNRWLNNDVLKTYLIVLTGLTFLLPPFGFISITLLFICNNSKLKPRYSLGNSAQISLCIFMALAPMIILLNMLSMYLLSDFNHQDIVYSVQQNLTWAKVISIVIFSPIIEELYFRQILFIRIKAYIGPFWGILITAFYFSVIHLNILAAPTLFALSILFGVVANITGTIIFSILLHSLFNIFMLTLVL